MIWGQRWTRRDLDEGEVDMDLLLWGIERSACFDAFGRLPVTVRIELTDRPTHKRFWWFLNADGRCQLCISDPGGATDLYLAATVVDFIRVFRADLALGPALDSGRLEAIGCQAERRALGRWLNLSPPARVRQARAL